LNTATQPVRFRAEASAAWLCFAPIRVHSVPVPGWVSTLFRAPSPDAQSGAGAAIAAAEAGSAHDYLVLQWPDGTDLRALQWPGETLARYTRRALIITCLSDQDSMVGSGYKDSLDNCIPSRPAPHTSVRAAPDEPARVLRIQLRYMAPQYSPSEDSATGSAMRVLASYWQSRLGACRLEAWQRSAGGGLLHTHIDEQGRVWVGGKVAVQALGQQHWTAPADAGGHSA
jgi:hypothetical protein